MVSATATATAGTATTHKHTEEEQCNEEPCNDEQFDEEHYDTEHAPLFDPELLDAGVAAEHGVAARYVLRPLCRDDHDRGHAAVLAALSPGALPRAAHRARFAELQRWNAAHAAPGLYFVVVAAERATGRVVASATALVEHKFTHSAGRVAHIEDVAVHPAARGRGLGTALVALLVRLARTHARCYKAVLCCAPARRAFYEHCGFVPLETEMVCPLLDAPSPPPVLDTEH